MFILLYLQNTLVILSADLQNGDGGQEHISEYLMNALKMPNGGGMVYVFAKLFDEWKTIHRKEFDKSEC